MIHTPAQKNTPGPLIKLHISYHGQFNPLACKPKNENVKRDLH